VIELTLPKMTCGHCVKSVSATVQKADAAASMRIESARPAEDLSRR